MNRTYIAIDLKSFYASVECIERGLDPLTALLVVADESRTDKTICLAVSPALKAYGIPGRARLWEVRQKAKNIDFIITPPRMALYLEYSNRIMEVYQKYVAPEDIHKYSVDEVFMDITNYKLLHKLTPRQLTTRILLDVLHTTGITGTAGIGNNLYLAKVAMDILAKHTEPDEHNVRIAELNENNYRQQLWHHTPITDFWRVGRRTAEKLARYGIHTMGQLARASLSSENLLFKLFGVNAELLIDHAWGWEPCRISDIKAYKPHSSSISSGQVLSYAYPTEMAKVVVREMAEALALDLLAKHLCTNQIVLTIGYDTESLQHNDICEQYHGTTTSDFYGREVPTHAHGSQKLASHTYSAHTITESALQIFERIINPILLVRRINITAANVLNENQTHNTPPQQLDFINQLFGEELPQEESEKEQRLMKASLAIHKRYGKNALLKGINFDKGATGRDRNEQIGGHQK